MATGFVTPGSGFTAANSMVMASSLRVQLLQLKKKMEPNWTQLQTTGLSGCSWASLLMVTVVVAQELSQDPTGCNQLSLPHYLLQMNFILHVIYLVHNKSGACPKNNGLDGQGFINIDTFAHVCTCVVQVNDNATHLFVCAIVIASSTFTTTTIINTTTPVALPP